VERLWQGCCLGATVAQIGLPVDAKADLAWRGGMKDNHGMTGQSGCPVRATESECDRLTGHDPVARTIDLTPAMHSSRNLIDKLFLDP